MQSALRLGRIAGIEIGIHYTLFIAIILMSSSLAVGYFPTNFTGWDPATYWMIAILATILLFVSVLFHEFGHAFVALARGVPVRSINLFIFGGVAQIARDADRPLDEFLIATAGPIVSVLIAVVCWVLRPLFGLNEQVFALLSYLATINAVLCAFNLLPGFPLDGGRVLRSIIWGSTNDQRKATMIAAGVGQFIAYGFIFLGLWGIFNGRLLNGLWIAFIGWFLLNATQQAVQQQEA